MSIISMEHIQPGTHQSTSILINTFIHICSWVGGSPTSRVKLDWTGP